ncbi:MAG: hypothetical protein GY953_42220 [bacterium]|nr:hypothetical protein [bacterium]
MNGVILWKGRSRLNGAPIVAVMTGLRRKSRNGKTGAMLQTWILHAEIDPLTAVRTGEDCAICGDCPHRGGTCYVTLHQAPLAVFRAFERGNYPNATGKAEVRRAVRGKAVRFGAYGDPGAVPAWVWENVVSAARATTGYTHRWRTVDRRYRRFLQASVDSAGEARQAEREGWRYFRIRESTDAPLRTGEIACPASAESGSRKTCASCALCSGRRWADKRPNVAIVVH